MGDTHEAKLRTAAVKAGSQVISAWFYDEKFRKAFTPDPKFFVNENQKVLTELMSARGPEWGDGDMYLAEAAKHPKLKKVGGYRAIEALIHGTPTAIDPWQSVKVLMTSYCTRELRRMTQLALMDPLEGADLGCLQKRLSEALNASVLDATKNTFSIRDVIESSWENSTRVKEQVIISSGYEDIDKATGQIRRKSNWLIGAETNWGKSTWAVFLVWLALLAERKVLVVSSEDPPELYGDRMISLIAKINAAHYRDGKSSPEDLKRITDVRAKYSKFVKPFFVKANGRTVEQVAGEIASYIAGEGIDIVLGDWLQAFLTLKDFGPNTRAKVTHIGKTLFDVVKNGNAAGVFFSQLTRIAGQKSPNRDWIRDSKDLIMMADVVGIGTINKEVTPVYRGMKIEKVKNGWSGFEVPLNFNTTSACFEPDEETMRNMQVVLTANEMSDFLAGDSSEVQGFDEYDRYNNND